MKIVMMFLDGSAVPAVRGLRILNKNEDYLVLIYKKNNFDDKNIVKELAGLPPNRVVEVDVDSDPVTVRTKVSKVFEHLRQLKIPRNIEVILLPTPGGTVNRYHEYHGGGRERVGRFDESPPSMKSARVVDSADPILVATVYQAIKNEADNRYMTTRTILAVGEWLMEDEGGVLNHLTLARLTVAEWMAISKSSPTKPSLPAPVADFLSANEVNVTWTSSSSKTAAGFGEVGGKVFRLVYTSMENKTDLELFALKSVLSAKLSGVELPTLILAKVLNTQKMSDDLSIHTVSSVWVADMGENPLRDPGGVLDNFLDN